MTARARPSCARETDLDAAWDELAPKPLILEGFVDFACEISVIAARGQDGAITAFDAVENRHRDGILDLTLAPARIPPEIAARACDIGQTVAASLDLVGLIAVEMFVDRTGRVLANEIAPRPHNSGHWTIEACPASQFELHIRAVAGLPLPPATRHADAVMKNLVGPEETALWPRILAAPNLIPHLYGKEEARPGRKMGHVTRLFPHGALPGEHGIAAALGILRELDLGRAAPAAVNPARPPWGRGVVSFVRLYIGHSARFCSPTVRMSKISSPGSGGWPAALRFGSPTTRISWHVSVTRGVPEKSS